MSYAEYPADTDAEKILHGLDDLKTQLNAISERLDNYRDSLNQTGENVAWLVQNVQNIFAMVNSPQFMNQLMGSVMGGLNGGQAGEPAGTAAGTDA